MTKPNILFLFPDQHRFDWAGWHPTADIRTPNLDRLAKEGVHFTQCVTPSPLCSPARACVATGREYEGTNVFTNNENLILTFPNLYRMLRDEAGYHVTGCGKFDLAKPMLDWGGDGKRLLKEYGFSDGCDSEGKWDGVGAHYRAKLAGRPAVGPYCKYLESLGLDQLYLDDMGERHNHLISEPTELPDEAYGDNWVGRNGADLIRNAPKDKPWFLQVNFPGPHNPWDITKSMAESVRDRTDFPQPVASNDGTQDQHLKVRQNYTAMVENIDAWVGKLMDVIEERGELDNTLIVFTSDHGEMLGDTERWAKSVPYQASAFVPMVVWGPGIPKGEKVDAPTSVLDVTATFLKAAGLDVPEDMDSRPLDEQTMSNDTARHEFVFSGLNKWNGGSWRMVYDGRYKLVMQTDGPVEAYDLQEDPNELTNAADTLPSDIMEKLEAELRGHYPMFFEEYDKPSEK